MVRSAALAQQRLQFAERLLERKMATTKVTIRDGELKRYEVDVECKTQDSRIQKAYQGTRTNVLVFAANREDARAAAIEMIMDKWQRHQGLRTKWIAHNVREA
jgi:hypothetical protein